MNSREQKEVSLRENITEAMVEAALQGHELEPFEPVDEPGVLKYRALCLRCGKSVYVSSLAHYSILEDICPG